MMEVYLNYKAERVGVSVEKDGDVLFSEFKSSNVSRKEFDKLEMLRRGLTFIKLRGFRGDVKIILNGRNLTKWVTGQIVPPDKYLGSVFGVRFVLRNLMARYKFEQRSTVHVGCLGEGEEESDSLLGLLEKMERMARV